MASKKYFATTRPESLETGRLAGTYCIRYSFWKHPAFHLLHSQPWPAKSMPSQDWRLLDSADSRLLAFLFERRVQNKPLHDCKLVDGLSKLVNERGGRSLSALSVPVSLSRSSSYLSPLSSLPLIPSQGQHATQPAVGNGDATSHVQGLPRNSNNPTRRF
jgi:hypothetical protein